jgi:hypothetical protein
MRLYQVTLCEAAERRIQTIAAELGRSVESLIEAAAEESALEHFRHRADDPAGRLK